MKRVAAIALLTVALATVALILGSTPQVGASDCNRTSVDLTPLTDLGTQRYLGYEGGLYGDGQNVPPAAHKALAMATAAAVQPLAPSGSPSSNGRIVLLSIGMSNTTQEYQAFIDLARGDPQINPRVLLVDGAQGGQTADIIRDPAANFWTVVDQRLQAAGASRQQVQVIWLKEANAQPRGPFPELSQALSDDFEAIVHVAHDLYPNLKLLYLASRTYAGYASVNLNPEPYAYESGFAVRWLIEKQMGGDPSLNADPTKGDVPIRAPVLLWGPYLWADGLRPRSDGLLWRCADFESDGTHPAASGRQKVANLLMGFFKTNDTTRSWFMADPNATPFPSQTAQPTETGRPVTPSNTPRWGRPTPGPPPTMGPAALTSYRVQETPSGDQMWISTRDMMVQRTLENLRPNQSVWVCSRVIADANAEWGFQFDPDRLTIAGNPSRNQRSTIRRIAAAPATSSGTQCIQVSAVVERVDGPPPPPGTPTPTSTGPTPTPTRTATPTATLTAPSFRTATPTPTDRAPSFRTATPTATNGKIGGHGTIYLPLLAKK